MDMHIHIHVHIQPFDAQPSFIFLRLYTMTLLCFAYIHTLHTYIPTYIPTYICVGGNKRDVDRKRAEARKKKNKKGKKSDNTNRRKILERYTVLLLSTETHIHAYIHTYTHIIYRLFDDREIANLKLSSTIRPIE